MTKQADKQKLQRQRTPTSLSNYYMTTRIDEKLSRLAAFLQDHCHEKIIVFFLTCACVEFFGGALQQLLQCTNGQEEELPSIELLHGKLVQKRREKTLERFHSNKCSILACTDVAARGLDVVGVDWVVQFDAPQDPAVFVHRVGRTARAGRPGQSLLFLTPKEEAYIELLHMRQVPIVPLPPTERCCPPPPALETEQETKSKSNKRLLRSAVSDEPLTDVLPLMRELVVKDRDLLEKGTKAFTSYIRAYKEHRCAFIFRYVLL
jgi:ATP-dependent RNA helicase DDX55/SPB4